jgi:hypothetical protein
MSEAEIIRWAIDQQVCAETAHALPLDPQAWQEARRFMLELRTDTSHAVRESIDNREDLYAERMRRHKALNALVSDSSENTLPLHDDLWYTLRR